MGILTAIMRWTASILLMLSIAAFLITTTGAHFTEKENLSPIIQDAALQQFTDSQLNDIYNGLSLQCSHQNSEILNLPVSGRMVAINCTILNERKVEEVKDIIGKQVTDSFFNEANATQCSGISCISKAPLGLVGPAFNSFLETLQIVSFFAIAVFAALVFLLSKGISRRFMSLGYPFLLSGVVYFFLGSIKAQILANMSGVAVASAYKIADAILDYLSPMFLAMFIIGAILIVSGLVLRFILKIK